MLRYILWLSNNSSEVSVSLCAAHANILGVEVFARSVDLKGCSFVQHAISLLDSPLADMAVYVRPEAAFLLGIFIWIQALNGYRI